MDDNEFEFPPDQLDDAVASRLSPYQTAMPSPFGPTFAQQSITVPLSSLVQLPVSELPPTRATNPQNFSIGQVMRGALSTAHMRGAPGGSGSATAGGGGARRSPGVAPLPHPPPRVHYSSASTSPYLSAGLPPVASGSSSEEDRDGGAEDAHHTTGSGSAAPVGGGTEVPLRAQRFSGRHARIDWSEGEVRSFYQALSQYGTDFSAIAVLFPGRTRSDIKRLYQREMRQKPKEVQTALNEKHPIDMAAFEVRYEAKKKETQEPVKKKELNHEELAILSEIESGHLALGTATAPTDQPDDFDLSVPAATPRGAPEETTAAPPTSSRKRRRDGHELGSAAAKRSAAAAPALSATATPHLHGDDDPLFNLDALAEHSDSVPLAHLYAVPRAGDEQQPVSTSDADFAFE